ncbi:hypothetical protein AAFF_G00207340 [Aldrovandia affinis]|uniref:Uncharacterized protein n=1 Tax=Aldrovandia affinis TaxID=143900 RepID=A0AAD7RHJ5_9TELE|nr:hypothetical protein AAFF_G00207340 [Aldrovandia affinis]
MPVQLTRISWASRFGKSGNIVRGDGRVSDGTSDDVCHTMKRDEVKYLSGIAAVGTLDGGLLKPRPKSRDYEPPCLLHAGNDNCFNKDAGFSSE